MTLEARTRELEETNISDSDVVSDSDDECYESEGSCLALGFVKQRKWNMSSLWPKEQSAEDPHVTQFMMY